MTGTGTATAAVRDGCLGIFNVLIKPNLPGLLSVIKILLRELNNILYKSFKHSFSKFSDDTIEVIWLAGSVGGGGAPYPGGGGAPYPGGGAP